MPWEKCSSSTKGTYPSYCDVGHPQILLQEQIWRRSLHLFKKELLFIQNTSPFWLALILRLILHKQHFPHAKTIFKNFEWAIKKITEFLSEPVIHCGRNYNTLLHLYTSLHHIQPQAIIVKYHMHVNLTATYLSLFACDVIIISWLLLIPFTSIIFISFTGTYEHSHNWLAHNISDFKAQLV